MKMIVTDLDGTLLRDDKTVSQRTKDALRRCQAAGIKTVFATGRGGSAVNLATAELFDGWVLNNGATAVADGKIVHRCLVPHELARPVLLACHERGYHLSAQLDGIHYTNFPINERWAFIHNFEIVDCQNHAIDAEKLNIDDITPEDAAFVETLLPPQLYLTVSRDRLGQIMHRGATKSSTVAELARLWSVKQEEITAFGDDLNDIDLLRWAGIGVAMGNALPEVRAFANCVTLSNEEDGLAVWVNKALDMSGAVQYTVYREK